MSGNNLKKSLFCTHKIVSLFLFYDCLFSLSLLLSWFIHLLFFCYALRLSWCFYFCFSAFDFIIFLLLFFICSFDVSLYFFDRVLALFSVSMFFSSLRITSLFLVSIFSSDMSRKKMVSKCILLLYVRFGFIKFLLCFKAFQCDEIWLNWRQLNQRSSVVFDMFL